jgi:hypothetical protein
MTLFRNADAPWSAKSQVVLGDRPDQYGPASSSKRTRLAGANDSLEEVQIILVSVNQGHSMELVGVTRRTVTDKHARTA